MKRTKLISLIALIATMFMTLSLTACGEPSITGIEFDTTTLKTQYSVGESVDKNDVKFVVSYDDESQKTFSLSDPDVQIVTDFDTTTVGNKKFTVKYKEITVNFDYTVVAVYQSLSFVQGTYKTVYDYGETIDYSQIKIIASYNDGTSTTLSLTDEGVTKSTINTSQVGAQTLSASYNGKTTEIQVEVKAVLTGIELKGYLLEYGFEQENATENVYILASYNDSTTKKIYLNEEGVEILENINTSVVSEQTLKVSYGGFEAQVQVTIVQATVKSIEIDETTLKSEYKIGSTDFNPSEIQINVSEYDGTTTILFLNSAGVSYTVDSDSHGVQVLQVSYGGRVDTVNVNFVAVLQRIEFKQATQTVFGYNQAIDYSKILVTLVYNDVSVNRDMTLAELENAGATLNKISINTIGEQNLSATYEGKTCQLDVKVVALVTKIELTQDVYELKLNPSQQFDYSTIRLTVFYNDTTSIETSLTDSNYANFITHSNNVSLSQEALNVIFTVTFEDYVTGDKYETSSTVNVRKEIEVVSVAKPQYYIAYLDNSKTENCSSTDANKFAVANKPYLVGTVNGFKFEPAVMAVDFENVSAYDVINPTTSYKLYINDGENGAGNYVLVDDPTEYIKNVRDNIYWFKESAENKYFKLEVLLDPVVYSNIPNSIEATFKVVYGYNVYDTYGLSVMDNLNVKNWAKIKNRILPYDDKYLYEYTDVTEVILHNDIVVNADQLPENYFWTKNTPLYSQAVTNLHSYSNGAYDGLLLGSLRDGVGGEYYTHGTTEGGVNKYDLDGDGTIEADEDFEETWDARHQKGIFNTDQCSITGNYMKISLQNSETRRLETVLSKKHNKGGNPTGHWSLFKFYKSETATEDVEVNIHFQDVYIVGNMGKSKDWGYEGTANEGATPAGLMAGHMTPDVFTADNLVLNQFYVHFVVDEQANASSVLDFKNSHLSDAYSNMFFLWRSKVKVTNSIMKNAGGPIFVADDGDRVSAPSDDALNKVKENFEKYDFGTESVDEDDCGPSIIVDKNSYLESLVTGLDSWFVENDASAAVAMISELNNLIAYNTSKSFITKDDNNNDLLNFIAVIIPETGTIFSARPEIEIYGKISRELSDDSIETFQMNDSMTKFIKQQNTVGFTSNGNYAFMSSPTSLTVWPGKDMFNAGLKQQYGDAYSQVFGEYEASDALGLSGIPASDFTNSSSDWIGLAFRGDILTTKQCPYIMAIFGSYNKL